MTHNKDKGSFTMYSMMTYQQELRHFQIALLDLWEYQYQSVEQMKNFYAANPMLKDAQQIMAEIYSVNSSNNWMSFFQQCWFAPQKHYEAFEELMKLCIATDQRLINSGQNINALIQQGSENAIEIASKPSYSLKTLTLLLENHLETLRSLENDQEAMGSTISGFNSALKIWRYQLMAPTFSESA